MKKTLKYILEAIKWMLLPITFPFVIALFCLGIALIAFGYAAVALFDKFSELEIVPMRFLCWMLKECKED